MSFFLCNASIDLRGYYPFYLFIVFCLFGVLYDLYCFSLSIILFLAFCLQV